MYREGKQQNFTGSMDPLLSTGQTKTKSKVSDSRVVNGDTMYWIDDEHSSREGQEEEYSGGSGLILVHITKSIPKIHSDS